MRVVSVCAGLREACEKDIDSLCAIEKEQVALTEGAGADSQVINCLEVSTGFRRRGWMLTSNPCIGVHSMAVLREQRAQQQQRQACATHKPGCVQNKRTKIKSPRCREEVARQMERASQDIRFDHTLAQQCYADREKYCSGVQPVGGTLTPRTMQAHF